MTSTEALVCCGKTFTQKGNHKRHTKTVHSARIRMPCGGWLKPRTDNVRRHENQCETCKCLRRGHPTSQNDSETESETIQIEDRTSPRFIDPSYMESTRGEGFDPRHLDTAPPTADPSQTGRTFVSATLDSAIPVDTRILIGLIDSIFESQVPPTLLDTTLSNAMGRHMGVDNGNVGDTSTYYFPYNSDDSVNFEEENAYPGFMMNERLP
ncbi:hypothetical protein JMJ77_0002459 [Colletotrichum scovillei]|uniref:Uncharacterized protein n=1 Tax=Colletotrichum scovillei TaxID=1209932 RepID=A0A9P7UJK6_9PEZI|nr:hypothetical protein JMJ77_0002459 [Colletotrichum scovillei]KAG7070879.1 hypothetical protein JMJ76_0002122 [Colletotrichum scovillei]KAG7079120.1 hypothetical protein JMJ78_0002780 [Colletotrichum scovillei]